jgi:DNA-binding NarL/FixJ family response regulator
LPCPRHHRRRLRVRHGAGGPRARALSDAELRVALAVDRGLTNRQVAVELAVSPKTVNAHLQSIYRKLEVHSRTALALLVERERTTS